MTLPANNLAEELRLRNLWATRVAALLGALLMPPGIPLDWLNDATLAPHFAWVRVGAAAVSVVAGLLTYTRLGARHPSVLFAVITVTCGAALGYMSFQLGGFVSPYYVGVLHVMVAVAVLSYWPWQGTAALCMVLLLVWLVPALFDQPGRNPSAFANSLFALTIVVLIGAIASAARRRATVRELTAKHHLAHAMKETEQALAQARHERAQSEQLFEQVTQMRQQRLTWLENLAHFLRHELKNQIVAVGTSIDLAKDGESLDANRIYLGRAQKSLDRMRGLVSSATEATSLEAALEADELERVDLSAMVAERVLQFQELHQTSKLSLTLVPGLHVWGSEERLVQLLDKLLNNAIEHAPADAQIRVLLRSDGENSIELCVENEGEPLPRDKERIFEAFVSSQRRPENLGLGLFVARSIALNHHGSIRAEPLLDSTGARFVVQLPRERMAAYTALAEESPEGFPEETPPNRALTESAD